jgi:hypothetical protein
VTEAVFGDESGIVLEIERETEAAGHDGCTIRDIDGVLSLATLPGL